MKGIITLLILICFYFSSVGQSQKPKAQMPAPKKEAAKKKTEKQHESGKKKEVKAKPAQGKKPVVAAVHPKESVSKALPEKAPAPIPEKTPMADTPEVKPVEAAPITANDSTHLTTAAEDSITTPEPPMPEPKKASFDFEGILSWLSLGLIIGMGIYVFSTHGSIQKRLTRINNEVHKLTSSNWDKAARQSGMTNADVEHLIVTSPSMKNIKEEFSAIKERMERLQQPVQQANVPVSAVEEIANSTFYMTGPTNNYFPSSAKSNNKENTVYKFSLQPGGNEAKFEIHTTGASINEIIKVIESYIKPACDEENLPFAGTRYIKTKTPGIALLENDKWIIKHKAVIRYE